MQDPATAGRLVCVFRKDRTLYGIYHTVSPGTPTLRVLRSTNPVTLPLQGGFDRLELISAESDTVLFLDCVPDPAYGRIHEEVPGAVIHIEVPVRCLLTYAGALMFHCTLRAVESGVTFENVAFTRLGDDRR